MTLIRNFAHWFKRASASTTLRDARPHNNDLPKPEIEGLTRYDEVDLLALGTDTLRTYINYPGITAGDLIFPRWVGAAPSGESFDYFRDPFRVPSGVDPTVGVLYTIGNDEVQSAAGGWAFYSYQLHEERPDMESMRRFCYVGVRPRPSAETLSVALAAPSHDLVVAWRALGASMALVIPPYQAMQPGDRVAITLTGKDDLGNLHTWTKKLNVEVPGQHLQAAVDSTWVRRLEGEYFDAEYVIDFKDGRSAVSPVQRFRVDSKITLPDRLPAPSVDGHVPGAPLDPTRFRDGLTIRIPPYLDQGMAVSDRLLLYWLSSDNVYQVLRVDPSSIDSGALVFTLEPRWLMSSQGQAATLGYQFAREGSSLASELLTVQVLRSRELPAPIVLNAVAEKDGGLLAAYLVTSGALVDVPDDVDILKDEHIEVHWEGHAERGREIVTQPINTNKPRRFHVSAGSIAANMERNENAVAKRFKVFYRLVRDDGSYVESEHFMLRILPIEPTQYPQLQCPVARGSDLYLGDVPSGASCTLAPWVFIAEKQWVTVWVTGVFRAEVEEVIWDAEVTPQQVRNGLELLIPRNLLEQQMLNQSLTVHAHVSFDDKYHYFEMRSLRLTLRGGRSSTR